jgi:hypothetical protein
VGVPATSAAKDQKEAQHCPKDQVRCTARLVASRREWAGGDAVATTQRMKESKMRASKLVGLVGAAGLLLGAAAAPAGADPKGDPATIVCDNGQTYYATTADGGNDDHSRNDFTPAHDVNSTTTLVPVSFGEFNGSVSDTSGNVLFSFVEPASSKGQAASRARNTTTCTYSFSGEFVDEESGETLVFSGSGTVTGFVTANKR